MFIETGSDSPRLARLDSPAPRPSGPTGRQPQRNPLLLTPPPEPSPQPEKRGVVRTLFISDIHLGCRHSQAGPLLELLEQYEPEQIYIVGDFIDGWKLRNRWRWLPVYDQVLRRLMELKRQGTQLFYTPGNHDNFLRGFLANFGVIDIQDRFVHTAADGRRYVVMHGDQFDKVEQEKQWLSLVGSYAYDVLLTANWMGNRLRGKKHNPYAFCAGVKARVKKLVTHVSDFQQQLLQSAHDSDCDGVICGHIHVPRIEELGEVVYLNTGDWVENCSALVEFSDGSFELIRGDGELIDRLAARPEQQQSEPTSADEQASIAV
ncbi:UDP-2,3-diacylglucosamine hydrolase [Planctomycetes bacterium MalM25]|nr:UDP-2,3-diacylglucosamine hydrolase [Planctomycetes bacterium MalM25]